jgi:hypothetical protein
VISVLEFSSATGRPAYERVVLEDGPASISYRYGARDARLVVSAGARDAIPFPVRLDGAPPGLSHGVDVDEDGHGVLGDGVVPTRARSRPGRGTDAGGHVPRPGAKAYVFTLA